MANNYILVKTGADENIIKILFDKSKNTELKNFDQKYVLVETSWGQELAKILDWSPQKAAYKTNAEIKFIKFFENDDSGLNSYLINASKKEKEAFTKFRDLIKKNNLYEAGMKPIKTHLTFDQKKMIFYYTAPDRVDFRGLLRDLIGQYSYVIRLQQISPRSSAQIVGGAGICGNQVCCNRFLFELPKVNKNVLAEQGLAENNKEKFKGLCGRLRCCLIFEQKAYQEAAKNLPKIGSNVKINNQEAVVLSKNILKEEVLVEFKEGNRGTYKVTDLN
ncbi:MAG: regulatory iron-sulfur-containing complex subunit RicT [Patescibacteria group bacterium]|nr:regulatory iron-sulfur-containing complex subunit RicT [Patescibacteria group bacterium]